MKGGVTLGAIFRDAGHSYRQRYTLSKAQTKAMRAIERCRTSALGGHVERCDRCGYERILYNSCRNRHCPSCQHLARAKWVKAREQELLPIDYFHIVFTLPDKLRPLTLINQRVMYNLLFRAASETLLQLSGDERHLGGVVGIIAVLHTWGQNLTDHPHVHCIVTGGGLSADSSHWVLPKKMHRAKKFFIHVNIISDLFKKKFLAYLKESYQQGQLRCVGRMSDLHDARCFQQFVNRLYAEKWVTYCKRPFGGARQVLRYLGRYTHRVALTNSRIKSYGDGQVVFQWKDYRDRQNLKLMTLGVDEFIRRFLLHILPDNFYRIRYYGLFANRQRRHRLDCCRQLMAQVTVDLANQGALCSSVANRGDVFDENFNLCPCCHRGHMIFVRVWENGFGLPP